MLNKQKQNLPCQFTEETEQVTDRLYSLGTFCQMANIFLLNQRCVNTAYPVKI